MSYLIRLVVITLSVISSLSFFSKTKQEEYSKNLGHPWEEYDSSYFKRFQTVENIINYADTSPGAGKKNSLEYYNLVAEILRKRFYHGYSYYNFSDNPLSYLAGHAWSHLSAVVIPDDIMKHPMAACSQQSLVLAEIFRRNKINYRKIAFSGHFALEGYIENKWRFFDTNMEPVLPSTRMSVGDLEAKGKIFVAYANTGLGGSYLHRLLSNPTYGSVNEKLALKSTVFHRICLLLVSKWFLFTVFILSFAPFIKMDILKKIFSGIPRLSLTSLESGRAT